MQYSNRTDTQNLRNELRSYERTENLVVKTQLQLLERDIDQVNQKFRDDMGNLKNNLMIELNDQKVRENCTRLPFFFFLGRLVLTLVFVRLTSERAERSGIASYWTSITRSRCQFRI